MWYGSASTLLNYLVPLLFNWTKGTSSKKYIQELTLSIRNLVWSTISESIFFHKIEPELKEMNSLEPLNSPTNTLNNVRKMNLKHQM